MADHPPTPPRSRASSTDRTPPESAVPEWVNDLFDIAAPSAQQPVVARLVPSSPATATPQLLPVELLVDSDVVELGRAKELPPPFRIDGIAKLSAKHCVLHVDPVTYRVTVKDTSTNGTFVNGVRVEKGAEVALQAGDRLTLCKSPTASETAAVSGASSLCAEYLFQRLRAETAVDKVVDELTCSVCRSVYLRPCSVLPCMHVFCAACISQWLRQGKATCAECRQLIDEVRPTHKIQSCVEQLLQSNPTLRRSEEEVRKLEASDDIPPAGKVLRQRKRARRDENSDDEFDSDDELRRGSDAGSDRSGSGGDGTGGLAPPTFVMHAMHQFAQHSATVAPGLARGTCPQCTTASTVDGFQCTPGQPQHLVCSACRLLFPDRPLCGRAQRCHLCTTPFCNLYYTGETGTITGCPAQSTNAAAAAAAAIAFLPFKEHTFASLPPQTFRGNTAEQVILTNYLATHNVTIAQLWETCLAKLQDGTWKPDLNSINGPLTTESAVCHKCAANGFAALLFHYRRAIPSTELPQSVTDRPNCWYGLQCRTQFHKPQHAQGYNHVCYQEKRKE